MPSLHRCTLRQLRIFEAAARNLHFGRAAAELHLSQPAVSIQLRQLEETSGLDLFEQSGRRMHLTPAGGELLAHARALLARFREADEALDALKGARGGELRIATTTTAAHIAPRLLAQFRRDRPAVRLRMTVDNRAAVVTALVENTVDLALMGQPPPGLAVSAEAFARHPLAMIASIEHPLVGRRRLRLSQLDSEPFLIRERGSGTRNAMEKVFAAQRFTPAETIEIGSNETIKQAVMAGLGVSLLSLHTVGLEVASEALARLDVRGLPVIREWFVIHRQEKRLTPVAAAFRAFLLECGEAFVEQATGVRGDGRMAPMRRR